MTSVLALDVATTWTEATNVADGRNRIRPAANASPGLGRAVSRPMSPCFCCGWSGSAGWGRPRRRRNGPRGQREDAQAEPQPVAGGVLARLVQADAPQDEQHVTAMITVMITAPAT